MVLLQGLHRADHHARRPGVAASTLDDTEFLRLLPSVPGLGRIDPRPRLLLASWITRDPA
jgi:hypothetical protein